ncbi:MAG TPA: hypothetical protein VGK53_10215 [Propionicimonas sp.]|jgi:hypothetical protein
MNYLVVYKAPISVRERFARATPEEARLGVLQWAQWAQRVGGALVYPGAPIGHALRVTSAGVQPTESAVVGLSILQAPDLDTAVAMVRDHHHLGWSADCEIELLEEMAIPELAAAEPATHITP